MHWKSLFILYSITFKFGNRFQNSSLFHKIVHLHMKSKTVLLIYDYSYYKVGTIFICFIEKWNRFIFLTMLISNMHGMYKVHVILFFQLKKNLKSKISNVHCIQHHKLFHIVLSDPTSILSGSPLHTSDILIDHPPWPLWSSFRGVSGMSITHLSPFFNKDCEDTSSGADAELFFSTFPTMKQKVNV